MNIDLTLEELEVLDKLANKLNLSYQNVLRQALRIYQLIDSGHSKLVETNPLPMMKPEKNAVDRAMELMSIKTKDLPPLALEWRNELCRTYGGCMEVCISAFAEYAQAVEGLPCDNSLYVLTPAAEQFFKEHK